MFTNDDLRLLEEKGITLDQLNSQLHDLATGFPSLTLAGAATPGHGIKVLTPKEEEEALGRWKQYLEDGGDVCKFVPASGAASRMFKAMFAFADGASEVADPDSDAGKIISNIHNLPFATELDKATQRMYGKSIDQLLEEKRHRDIIRAIIAPEGLNYGALPKGLLLFHSYPDGSRTPLEEHLTEGAQTAANDTGVVNLHFTVSAAHHRLFEEKLSTAIPAAEARTGKKFNVTLSEQKPSTDTVASNPDGTPFRKPDGSLLFRPGGHGALIENLNDLDSTVIFIKNIDNVVPDSRRDDTVKYKSVIAGYLIEVHDRIVAAVNALRSDECTEADVEKASSLLSDELSVSGMPDFKDDISAKRKWLIDKLNRPLRVCGMVRNEGEPGGGPYLAKNSDGTWSPQILEESQIDKKVEANVDMMRSATHFNPVDLVCYVKDVDGNPFDLRKYVDRATGFISSKSSEGRELLALELPGLWNGAMSDWNTIFVEVPATTFNPVKTVNDLLRPAHQN